jgi:hypothetical protein
MSIKSILEELALKNRWVLNIKDQTDTPSIIDAELSWGGEKAMFTLYYDPEKKFACITDYGVSYSSISQEYDNGKLDQFSPFDDGPPYSSPLTAEEWLIKALNYFIHHGKLKGIGWGFD